MSSVVLAIGASAAIVMTLGFLFVSHALAWQLCRTSDTPVRGAATIALLAWLPTALFHLLAIFHVFTRSFALAAVMILAAVTWRAIGGSVVRQRIHRDRLFLRRVASRFPRSPYRIAVIAFVVCALPPVLRAVVLPPLGWDTLTYHSLKAALWVQTSGAGRLTGIGPWAYYRDMPGGAEVFLAWTMLPLSSDAFTGLLDIAQWLAVGFSAMVLARQLGLREPFASTTGGFVMAIPVVRLMLGSAYSELCLLSTCLAGLALGLAAGRTRPRLLVLAGAALGVSAAAKFPMIVVTSVPLMLLVFRFFLYGPEHRGRWTLAAVAAYGVALVPWLVLAEIDTGAPFSPVPIALGPLVLGIAPPELDWYLQRVIPSAYRIGAELSVLRDIFSSPLHVVEGAGLFALIPIAGMWIGVPRLWRRQPFAVVMLLSVMLSCLVTFYAPTFVFIRHTWSVNSGRFLLPAIAIGIVAGVSWCRRRSLESRWFWRVLIVCALFNLLEYAFVGFSKTSISASAAVGAAVFVLSVACYGLSRLRPAAVRWTLATCVAIVSVVALQESRDALRNTLLQDDFALHGFAEWRYWAHGVAAVDDPAIADRIAITSGPKQNSDHWFAYPFMGRRLQNDLFYVPISGDGHTRHFGPGALNDELTQTGNFWAWHLRLRQQKITHVISFGPTSIELNWMEADPDDFERIEGAPGDSWGIFRVKA